MLYGGSALFLYLSGVICVGRLCIFIVIWRLYVRLYWLKNTDDEKREIQKAEYKMKTHEIEAYEFESIEAKYLANAQKREQQVLQGNAWICSKCQRINMAYVTSCPCGNNRNS